MATTFENRLITPELKEALASYLLYSQDTKKKDALCIAVFYLGNIRWYIMEGQQEGDDFTLYGIVAGLHETEYGYQSATEMAGITYDASKYGLGTLRTRISSLAPLERLRTQNCKRFSHGFMIMTNV